jgi:hypothetical protein
MQNSKNSHLRFCYWGQTHAETKIFFIWEVENARLRTKLKGKDILQILSFIIIISYALCCCSPLALPDSGCHIISVVRSCTGQNAMNVLSGSKLDQSSCETPNLLVATPSALNVFDDVIAIGMYFISRKTAPCFGTKSYTKLWVIFGKAIQLLSTRPFTFASV